MRLSERKKIALVLSGGGIKAAAFHIGVCLALREKGFHFSPESPAENKEANHPLTFKIYVGSSAGSVISTFLAAGYSIDSIISAFMQGSGEDVPITKNSQKQSYLKPISYRDIFGLNVQLGYPTRLLSSFFKKKPVITGGLEVLLKRGFKVNGLFTTKNIEKYLRQHVLPENSFKSLASELYIVATQLNHSRKVVFGNFTETNKLKDIQYANYAPVSEAVAASASLPPFFSPYPITDRSGKEIYFFDGEIRDTLSTHVAADHGADLVISSYSIQPYHYNKDMGSLHEYGIPLIFNQALYQTVQQKIEKHIRHQQNTKSMIKAAEGYLRQSGVAEEHIEKLTEILVQRSGFNPNVEYIYIHPSPQDHEFFFYDHFSLNAKVLSAVVKTGFKSAINILRKYRI
ncbi:MAG: patatin-like phospholipase family protein [Bdellovibrionales bacterium]|nr:patatin-like phospholipase family protein [Bdellovibrionales bacterium]